ncbi:MAG: VWA domain-containing protein [Myxococcota bacterium]
MRKIPLLALAVLLFGFFGCAGSPPSEPLVSPPAWASRPRAPIEPARLELEIHSPASDALLTGWEGSVAVEGGASVFGGVRYLDLMLVLDTSKSLLRTDPRNKRTAGAAGLVESLPAREALQIGVVDFDRKARLVSPLTTDRERVLAAIRSLDRVGSTNLSAGIALALEELEKSARPGSSRVILLFTDGKTNAEKARRAMQEARLRGVAIHTLLLGSSEKGSAILREIAAGTGGSFIQVHDPDKLPEAFLNLRTTGVEGVTVAVNGEPPVPVELYGGQFRVQVPLRLGSNEIVATATSVDGQSATRRVTVTVTGPMKLKIETPSDGTLFERREVRTRVEGIVDAFAELPAGRTDVPRAWDVASVLLRVDDSPPVPAVLEGDRFRAELSLHEGENRIVAVAQSLDGRSVGDTIRVRVHAPGCAALKIEALRDGRPALSISDRSVELVFDASNSMWGRIDDRPKISIAKEILDSALGWLPEDVTLALRAYGHQHRRELHECTDSKLLVPFGHEARTEIRSAIATLKPRGQTPIAYTLEQIAADFAGREGERAVVLVTDGIESCGGDPVAAARSLRAAANAPVHVIGFGLSSEVDEDPASLSAIAEASGGRFLTARNADELREALAVTVGTPVRVLQHGREVARTALGSDETLRLPAGEYQIRVESDPVRELEANLASEEALTVVIERRAGQIQESLRRAPTDYVRCELPLPAALDPDADELGERSPATAEPTPPRP